MKFNQELEHCSIVGFWLQSSNGERQMVAGKRGGTVGSTRADVLKGPWVC